LSPTACLFAAVLALASPTEIHQQTEWTSLSEY
jgi:hypothetical protein